NFLNPAPVIELQVKFSKFIKYSAMTVATTFDITLDMINVLISGQALPISLRTSVFHLKLLNSKYESFGQWPFLIGFKALSNFDLSDSSVIINETRLGQFSRKTVIASAVKDLE